MRICVIAVVAATLLSTPVRADEKLAIAPAPPWVQPVKVGTTEAKTDAAVGIILQDQQIDLQPGRQSRYFENMLRIQTTQGLAAGNVGFSWNPDTDTATVHKLLIRRGDKVIDVLASQRFTVVRRENNLENAVIDGVLTATIQPEGLQVGDIVDFAATVSRSDPGLKAHVESISGGWNGLSVENAHMRTQWPASVTIHSKAMPGLPELKPVRHDGMMSVEVGLKDLQPMQPPNGAPARFLLTRMWELTDFNTWGDLAALMLPLYEKASQMPSTGALRAELNRIATLSPDPKARAEAALALVQQRIRYVFIGMNDGGIVPPDAETTWSRRFGDCKAKTALLLALLHGLGIEAQAVLVNATGGGDGLDTRLPAMGLFNHVIVRAKIGGKVYWLDGTRDGDRNLDQLTTPFFHWGLPVSSGASLVPMVPAALAEPLSLTRVHIDASAGLDTPAPFHAETLLRDDVGYQMSLMLANQAPTTRDNNLRDYWRKQYNFIDVKTVSAAYDPAKREERLVVDGVARMDWSNGWYETDGLGLGYQADFSRNDGIGRSSPFAVGFPGFEQNEEVIELPKRYAFTLSHGEDVEEVIAGVSYHRRTAIKDGKFVGESSSRALASEFAASEAPTAQTRLRALPNKTVYIKKPDNYVSDPREVDAAMLQTPTEASAFVARGSKLLDVQRRDEAIRDFTAALKLEPRNADALAGRGVAYAWLNKPTLATADLTAAEAIDPKKPAIHHGRALLAMFENHAQAAISELDKAVALWPADGFALYYRAKLEAAIGHDDDALRDADAVLSKQPGAVDMRLLRANALRNKGQRTLAAAEGRLIESAAPKDETSLVVAGMILARTGELPAAIATFDRAIAIKPSSFIYLNRSKARPWQDFAGRTADLEAAKAAAAKESPSVANGMAKPSSKREIWTLDQISFAPVSDPKRLEALNDDHSMDAVATRLKTLGITFTRNKTELDTASLPALMVEEINKLPPTEPFLIPLSGGVIAGVILSRHAAPSPLPPPQRTGSVERNEPSSAVITRAQADLLDDQRKYAEAIGLLEGLVAVSPGDVEAHLALAIDRARLGDLPAAARDLAALDGIKTQPAAALKMCRKMAEANVLLDRAWAACETAAVGRSEDPETTEARALLLLRLNRFKDAQSVYDGILANRQTRAIALFGRSLAEKQLNNGVAEEADRTAAQKIDPDVPAEFRRLGFE